MIFKIYLSKDFILFIYLTSSLKFKINLCPVKIIKQWLKGIKMLNKKKLFWTFLWLNFFCKKINCCGSRAMCDNYYIKCSLYNTQEQKHLCDWNNHSNFKIYFSILNQNAF